MTHDEMIAVIAAHKEGKRLEWRWRGEPDWEPVTVRNDLFWNFSTFDYRIAEPKWRDATIDDLKRGPIPCRAADVLGNWRSGTLKGFRLGEQDPWVVSTSTSIIYRRYCQVEDNT